MIIGIDLAGSEKRNSGICTVNGRAAKIGVVHTDKEILKIIKAVRPKIVGIDAPLSLPFGRKSIEKKSPVHFRKCDLEIRKRGIRFFPITLGPMRMLTKRGMRLKKRIKAIDRRIEVIEIYPGATYDLFGIDRKDKSAIIEWAKKFVRLIDVDYTQDELDAVAAAITAMLYLNGKAVGVGNKKEGLIIIPQKNADEIRGRFDL